MKKSLCLIFTFLLFLGGCISKKESSTGETSNGEVSVPISSNNTSSIQLTPEYNKITTNGGDTGKTKITIQVLDDQGRGLRKTVTLEANLGKLVNDEGEEIEEITTNEIGQAEFYFESDTNPGIATVKATVDGVTNSTDIEIIKIGAISISSDKQYLVKEDSTLLHVQVTDIYGNPAQGIKVKLSSDNESIVSIGMGILTTDENGEATVYATAGSPGDNTEISIQAQSGDKFADLTLTVVAPNNMSMTITPTTINTGGETATISVQITDATGEGVPQIQVSFSSSLGELNPTVATTNNNGVATVYLTSGNISGTATITAKAGDLEVEKDLTIISSDVVNVPTTIELVSIENTEIYIQGSGNQESSLLTFRVLDGVGNPLENVRIQFSLVGGSIGGEYLVPTSGITNANGEVSTTLKAGTSPGTVKIKAWYNDEVFMETQAITIYSGPPEGRHLSMAITNLNIKGLILDGVEDTITARLADLYSNPVPEGTAVHFESEYAKLEGADTSTGGNSTEPGVATADLFSQDPRPVNGAPVHAWVQTQSGAYAFISSLFVNGTLLYAATDGGGIFKSLDGGENWENIGKPRSYSEGLKGLWGTYIHDMAVQGNLIVVATEDGGVFYSEDGGYNWRDLRSRSDRWTDYNVSQIDTLSYYPVSLWERVEVEKNGVPYIGWGIIGKQFIAKDPGPYTITYDIDYGSPSSPAKLVKILDNNTFFAYFEGQGVWKFDKTQLRWLDFNQGLFVKDISTMLLVDTDSDGVKDTIFVSVGGQLYKSAVASADFQAVGAYQPVAFNEGFVLGTDLYYATTQGIKKFDALTNTWTDIVFNGCPESNIKHIVVASDGTIYIGTDLGVYRVTGGEAYPLNVYKERKEFTTETREIDLSYPCDQNKPHTNIYVNGVEMPSTYYDFVNATHIEILDDVDPIPAGAVVEIYYVLASANGTYVTAPQKKITTLFFAGDKLYWGTEGRKVYVLDNPSTASETELPELKDISGLVNQISCTLYKTTQVMFTGDTVIQAFWDSDGDGFFDNAPIVVANATSINIFVTVTDINGRPLVAGSQIEFSTDVGSLLGASSVLPDVQYGGEGVTEFWLTLADSDTDNDPASGGVQISVTSENGNQVLIIPVTVY